MRTSTQSASNEPGSSEYEGLLKSNILLQGLGFGEGLGPSGHFGSNLAQHSPTSRPSVETTAEKAFCLRIAFGSPVQRLEKGLEFRV